MDKEQTQVKSKQPIFEMLKVYVKNMSFDTPNIIRMSQANQKPSIKVDLNVVSNYLEDDVYEVVLNLVITNRIQDKIVFLIEMILSGNFLIKNFSEEEIKKVLNTTCPSLLFPDIREIVSNITIRGGFPPLYLKPIDFDLIYQQQVSK